MHTKALHKAICSLSGLVFAFSQLSIGLAADINSLKDVLPKDVRIGIYLDLINNEALSINSLGNFRPDESINKVAFFKAALAYQGFKPAKSFNFFTGYSDIPEQSWFSPYIKKALEIRVITNNLGDKFNPDSTLTRQEALLFTMDFFGLPTPLLSPQAQDLYTDIRLSHPLASLYAAAKANGIYFENDQETFYPNKTLTRGDAADLLFKAKLAQNLEGVHYPDATNSVTISIPTPTYNNNSIDSDLLDNEKFNILLDTWSKINNQFIYTDNVSKDKLVYGAISGMVNSLNDPYSTFKSPNTQGNSYIYIPENYEGIGAIIEQIDGKYLVQTTLTNSPAYRSGLKSKDIILEIDGKTVNDLTYEQVTGLIKGKAGTIIKLKIKRDNIIYDYDIVREKITVEAIQRKELSNGVNYLRLDQFTENSYQEFNTHLKTIAASGSKKLIIDLRNNPGGYLTSTQDILGHFLAAGQVEFYTASKGQVQTAYLSKGTGELKDYKIAVLINEGSASASEIFAGTIQDYGLGYLIGTTTFGKGSVQEITSYSDNSSLKLTIAKWLTPKKRDINHIGIVPDLTVKITAEQRQRGQDPQLDAALNYLK